MFTDPIFSEGFGITLVNYYTFQSTFRIKNRARKLSFSFTRILSIQAWKPIIFLAWNALGFALSKFVALLHFLDIIYHGGMTDWKISLQIASIIYKPQHSHFIDQTYQENRKGDPWNKYVFVNLSLRNVHAQWGVKSPKTTSIL